MTLTPKQVEKFQKEVLAQVNEIRRKRNLGEVRMNESLSLCAKLHTRDQMYSQGRITHHGEDKSELGERLRRVGYIYKLAGENVASGQRDATHVVTSLMNSKGHRENILRREVDEMGLFVDEDGKGKKFWTQLFGNGRETMAIPDINIFITIDIDAEANRHH